MMRRFSEKVEPEDINERNLLNNLKSNNETIKLKALSFAKKNFNYLDNYTIIELAKDIPLYLADGYSQIVETTLKIILLIYSGNMQEHINARLTLTNIIEKSMVFEDKGIHDNCELIINMFLQNMEASEYLTIVKAVLKNDNARILNNSFSFINMGLEEFGIKNLNYLKDILPILENLMKSMNGDIIQGGIYIYKQIYKYMGEGLDFSINKLSTMSKKEIKKFVNTWGKIKLTGKRDIGVLQDDENDLEPQINIWSKYTEEWTRRVLIKKSWKDKLPELRNLERDLNVSRLSKGNYSKVLDVLKDCTSDPHVLIKIKSIKCIGLLCKGLRKDFKEYISLFTFLLPIFKSNSKRIIEVLNETIEVISAYLKLTDITHCLCDALKDNNPIYKENLINFIEMIIKMKLDNNLVNEVEYFKNHSDKILLDLTEDAKLEVRTKAKKLIILLKETLLEMKMSISGSFSSIEKKKMNKLKSEFSEISDIVQNESFRPSNQHSPIYTRKSTKYIKSHIKTSNNKSGIRNSVIIKPLQIKKRNSFLRKDLTTGKNFLNSKVKTSNSNLMAAKNYMSSRKLENFNTNFLLNNRGPQKQKNLNLIEPHIEKSMVLSQEDSLIIEKIDWDLKKDKLLKNILKVFDLYEDIPYEELNDILLKLKKVTSEFRDVSNSKRFYSFCKFIAVKDCVEINEKTFLILKNVISTDLQKGNKMSINLTEKLVQQIGPFRFFKLILNYLTERGFNHKNFIHILYQLCQNISPDLLFDAHLVLLHRNIQLYFSNMDFLDDFTNLLHHILQPRIFYLKEIYIELSYINFGELHEIEEIEYMKFPEVFYEEMKQLGQDSMALESNQGIVDITDDIKILHDFNKMNSRKKKECLDKFLILLLKNPKFKLKKKSSDSKVQDILANCLAGNESNKIILKLLSKIIFLYSHTNNNPKFKFLSKYLSAFIPVFLKDKNNVIRKYFSLALKRHLMNEKIKKIYYYFKLLEDKNVNLKSELLELLHEYFDNQSEKVILKIDKKKVFPILFKLIKTKKSQIKIRTTDLLNFFLSFFSQKEMKSKAAKVSKEALEFVSNFYLLSSHNKIETIDKSHMKIMDSGSSFKDSKIKMMTKNDSIISEKRDCSISMNKNMNKGIKDDFIDFIKLESLSLEPIIENLQEIIHLVFHFKISEFLRTVLYSNGINNLVQFEIILKKMLEPHIILSPNIIPLFLSILFNLLSRYPKTPVIYDFCLNNLSFFADSLKTEEDNLFCLESEEFSLFVEIIRNFNFEEREKIQTQDQIVQNIILYHIQTNEKQDLTDLIRMIDNEKWLETYLVNEKIDDIFEEEDYEIMKNSDKIIYSFAFGTKDSIVDTLLENKFTTDVNDLNDEELVDIIIAFTFLIKRISKTILMTDSVNENFLNFIMTKFEELLKIDLENLQDELLTEIFRIIIYILFLEPTLSHPKLQNFIKNIIESISKEKIARTLTFINFQDEEMENYLNTILVRTLENESTGCLVDITLKANLLENANEREENCKLNKIGLYLVDVVRTKDRIEEDMKEIDHLNDLIEEYNDFNW